MATPSSSYPYEFDDEPYARQLAPVVRREVAEAPWQTTCSHCRTTAPAIRMPAGQLCHNCSKGVMQ